MALRAGTGPHPKRKGAVCHGSPHQEATQNRRGPLGFVAMSTGRFLTIEEVAEELNISVTGIRPGPRRRLEGHSDRRPRSMESGTGHARGIHSGPVPSGGRTPRTAAGRPPCRGLIKILAIHVINETAGLSGGNGHDWRRGLETLGFRDLRDHC